VRPQREALPMQKTDDAHPPVQSLLGDEQKQSHLDVGERAAWFLALEPAKRSGFIRPRPGEEEVSIRRGSRNAERFQPTVVQQTLLPAGTG
jgi:hypothetical protein